MHWTDKGGSINLWDHMTPRAGESSDKKLANFESSALAPRKGTAASSPAPGNPVAALGGFRSFGARYRSGDAPVSHREMQESTRQAVNNSNSL